MSSKYNLNGIGMTSQRTRERLLGRLMDQGISSLGVLDVMRSTPRHIFLDEALSHRAYEDDALRHHCLCVRYVVCDWNLDFGQRCVQ